MLCFYFRSIYYKSYCDRNSDLLIHLWKDYEDHYFRYNCCHYAFSIINLAFITIPSPLSLSLSSPSHCPSSFTIFYSLFPLRTFSFSSISASPLFSLQEDIISEFAILVCYLPSHYLSSRCLLPLFLRLTCLLVLFPLFSLSLFLSSPLRISPFFMSWSFLSLLPPCFTLILL